MKEPVLTDKAKVVCNHGGLVTVTASQHTFLVAGSPVLVGDLKDSPITNCVPPSGPACTKVQSTTGGTAALLQVDGKPALLVSASGTTDAGGTWRVLSAGQTTLVAS